MNTNNRDTQNSQHGQYNSDHHIFGRGFTLETVSSVTGRAAWSMGERGWQPAMTSRRTGKGHTHKRVQVRVKYSVSLGDTAARAGLSASSFVVTTLTERPSKLSTRLGCPLYDNVFLEGNATHAIRVQARTRSDDAR